MKNPINTAAGTNFGYGWQFEGFYDVSLLGAITMKGVARVPWKETQLLVCADSNGGMMNSVDLANPGVDDFIAHTDDYERS